MNVNLSLGIVSFIIWSAFSTWYYVNFIKVFPESAVFTNNSITSADIENTTESDSLNGVDLNKAPQEATGESTEMVLERNLFYQKNSTDLAAPNNFQKLYDSLTGLKSNQIEVKITGYACDLGTGAYNLDLSRERAEAMAKMLKSNQVTITGLSYKGETDPLVPNTSESNRKKNRRVHLQISTK